MPRPTIGRVRKGKPLGLYGKPQDYMDKLRVPGMDAGNLYPNENAMPPEHMLQTDATPKKKRRNMSSGSGY